MKRKKNNRGRGGKSPPGRRRAYRPGAAPSRFPAREGMAPYGGAPAGARHTLTVGKRGTLVLPAEVRRRLGLDEGALVLAEEAQGGLLLRRAEAVPVEIYTPERIAEFLLSSAIGPEDYAGAIREVRKMGLDPEKVPHYKPRGIA